MSDSKNYVTLKVDDGSTMRAYTAIPAKNSHPAPGMLVFQEAFGVNSHIREIAERFCAEGFVTIAPELYHRTGQGFESGYTDFESVRPHMQAVTTEGLEADIRASFQWLKSNPAVRPDHIVSIGFCMGGRVSFLANSILPLKASASFYGGGIAPGLIPRAADLHGPMLFFWGGLDKHIPREQTQSVAKALDEAGKPYINVDISYADHGFFCNERASYQPQAAREAQALTLAFFHNNLG